MTQFDQFNRLDIAEAVAAVAIFESVVVFSRTEKFRHYNANDSERELADIYVREGAKKVFGKITNGEGEYEPYDLLNCSNDDFISWAVNALDHCEKITDHREGKLDHKIEYTIGEYQSWTTSGTGLASSSRKKLKECWRLDGFEQMMKKHQINVTKRDMLSLIAANLSHAKAVHAALYASLAVNKSVREYDQKRIMNEACAAALDFGRRASYLKVD